MFDTCMHAYIFKSSCCGSFRCQFFNFFYVCVLLCFRLKPNKELVKEADKKLVKQSISLITPPGVCLSEFSALVISLMNLNGIVPKPSLQATMGYINCCSVAI